MTAVLLVATLTLAASFLCSLLEAALYTVSPARIEVLRRQGARGAAHLARLRADIEQPIAAILTVNTIAHTVGSAWCGAMVGELHGSRAVGVFAAVFTFLVLALTEIVPKSLGVRYASSLGTLIVWPVQLMIWVTWPVVWLTQRAMRALKGAGGDQGPGEEEVVVVSDLAAQGGRMRAEEHRWVENALRLDRVTARDLRTPRTVVECLPAERSVEEAARGAPTWVHSRVPLTEAGGRDRVIGLVHRREVVDAALSGAGRGKVLRDFLRPIHFVPEAMPAHRLLEYFLAERAHMVAVADEYGGFDGIVTLEDVLECLLGEEIVDEHDQVADMQQLALERSRLRRAAEHREEQPPEADLKGESGDER